MRRIVLLLLAAAFHPVTAAQPTVSGPLSAAWSLPGRWSGVATNEKTGVRRNCCFRQHLHASRS